MATTFLSPIRFVPRLAICLLLSLASTSPGGGEVLGEGPQGDLVVDYGAIVDRNALTHSGQTVGEVLALLALPEGSAQRGAQTDATLHLLVDPLLEAYAHVLADTVASGDPERALVEVAALYPSGETQPAWVDLMRTRRFLLLSDGEGFLRVFLPGPDAGQAWEAGYGVVRHALAAERARLGSDRPLILEVYAYSHERIRSRFTLHHPPRAIRLEGPLPAPDRPPLDLAALERFLNLGLRLEGARLETDGGLTLFGSPAAEPPMLAGRPVGLSDLAVAYRAVFQAEGGHPYMSLDRSPYPEYAVVNYGGRLRDTLLGLVTLRCDIRFKTFSQGFDFFTGEDLRERIRAHVPGFRSHMERFVAAVGAEGVRSQQTRLWFYPDSVRLALSPSGDTLYIRSARMTAAAERVERSGQAAPEAPPWTRATTEEINADYPELSRLFPEMGELDTVARLLSLFAWLAEARDSGRPLPDLEALLALPLPPVRTPRGLPQLLVFTALDRTLEERLFLSADRSGITDRMGRLRPRRPGDITPRQRLDRALSDLPTRLEDQREDRARFEDLARAVRSDDEALRLAYEAERVWMHNRAIYHVDRETAEKVVSRERAGGLINVFSTAIGGLDLDMGGAVRSAWRPGATTVEDTSAEAPSPAGLPPEGWTDSLAGRHPESLPEHGTGETIRFTWPGGAVTTRTSPWTVVREGRDPKGRLLWRREHYHPRSGEEQVREIRFSGPDGEPSFTRYERGRTWHYHLSPAAGGLEARPPTGAPTPGEAASRPLPQASLSGIPATLWDLLPADVPLLGYERSDGEPVVLYGHPSNPDGYHAGDPPSADRKGVVLLEEFDRSARQVVAAASLPRATPGHATLGVNGKVVTLQLGRLRYPIPVEEIRTLLLETGPTPVLDGALASVSTGRLVLYRDSATVRFPWRGPGLRQRPEDDPVALMAALNGRSGTGPRLAVTADLSRAAKTLASLPEVGGSASIAVIASPERWPTESRPLLERFLEAGKDRSFRVLDEPTEETPPVLVMALGGGPASRARLLRRWGEAGRLRDRVLLVLPLHAPLEPALADALLVEHGARAVFLTTEALEPEGVLPVLASLEVVAGVASRPAMAPDAFLAEAVRQAVDDPTLGRRTRAEVLRILRGGLAF